MIRIFVFSALFVFGASSMAAPKEILLVAGKPSHPAGEHEHNAGVRLLAKWLNTVPGIHATPSYGGAWPSAAEFDKADAVFFYADGGESHYIFQDGHATAVNKAAARGAGLMFLHYATEPPASRGHEEMLAWLSGYFEVNYSVNPIYLGDFRTLPDHPTMRGVKPFQTRDEWYYNIRFPEHAAGLTPLLVTTPPASTIGPDGIRSGNADVRKKAGQPQTVAWAFERNNGGRSIGVTGGHFHANLQNPDFRKFLLNSLVWIATAEVPRDGVTVTVRAEDLSENLDPKPPRPAQTKAN